MDNMQTYEQELESQLRANPSCFGCGNHKEPRLIVCWECFKYVPPVVGVEPLKYHDLGLADWVSKIQEYRRVVRNLPPQDSR